MGEDRVFFAALRRIDAVIGHAPEVTVTVSDRFIGRAQGGMADTIRCRMHTPDLFLDAALEATGQAAARARIRSRLRCLWRTGTFTGVLARRVMDDLGIAPADLRALLQCQYFGEAWAVVEATIPRLAFHRVAVADLED